MSLTAEQIARAKKIIMQHKHRISYKKLSRADAVLVCRYVYHCTKELAEEAVAYELGEFKGDVNKSLIECRERKEVNKTGNTL